MRVLVTSLIACLVAVTAIAAQPRAGSEQPNSDWALLDSLGQAPRTTLIREYVLESGDVGREYASSEGLDRAPDAVTRYYEDKLFKLGWEQIERHAAISGYQKGSRIVVITRAGADDPGLTPGAKLLKERAVPADAKFFFAIETGPVHR